MAPGAPRPVAPYRLLTLRSMETKRVVREWVARVWNAGELEAIEEFHPGRFANEGRESTPEEARAWHREIRATFPDLRYQIEDLFEADDRVVVRWTASGTQTGQLWGSIPPTGKRVAWKGMHIVTVHGGKIIEVWAVSNMAAIPPQLGLKLVPVDDPAASL